MGTKVNNNKWHAFLQQTKDRQVAYFTDDELSLAVSADGAYAVKFALSSPVSLQDYAGKMGYFADTQLTPNSQLDAFDAEIIALK